VDVEREVDAKTSSAPDFEGKIGEQRREVISTMFKEGKSIQYGVLQADVDPSSIPSDKERKERIAKATQDLVNIDDSERGRRKLIGIFGTALSSAVYAGTLYFHVGVVPRLAALYLPVAFSIGFLQSANKGL